MKWLVPLALAGCNQVYGLEETSGRDDDDDDDGLLDVIDNCPLEPNPLQEDGDSDGLGDACDACNTGPNEDEDGDEWLDGCDNCPHIANANQANVDVTRSVIRAIPTPPSHIHACASMGSRG